MLWSIFFLSVIFCRRRKKIAESRICTTSRQKKSENCRKEVSCQARMVEMQHLFNNGEGGMLSSASDGFLELGANTDHLCKAAFIRPLCNFLFAAY